MAAGMFTISYSCAVIVPILSGLAWGLDRRAAAAFVPMAVGVVLMIGLAPTLGLASRTRPLHDTMAPPFIATRKPVTDTAARMTAESFGPVSPTAASNMCSANAGTDFAPIIEALSRHPGSNRKYPRVITVPHARTSQWRWRTAITGQRQAGRGDGSCHGRHRQRGGAP